MSKRSNKAVIYRPRMIFSNAPPKDYRFERPLNRSFCKRQISTYVNQRFRDFTRAIYERLDRGAESRFLKNTISAESRGPGDFSGKTFKVA